MRICLTPDEVLQVFAINFELLKTLLHYSIHESMVHGDEVLYLELKTHQLVIAPKKTEMPPSYCRIDNLSEIFIKQQMGDHPFLPYIQNRLLTLNIYNGLKFDQIESLFSPPNTVKKSTKSSHKKP